MARPHQRAPDMPPQRCPADVRQLLICHRCLCSGISMSHGDHVQGLLMSPNIPACGIPGGYRRPAATGFASPTGHATPASTGPVYHFPSGPKAETYCAKAVRWMDRPFSIAITFAPSMWCCCSSSFTSPSCDRACHPGIHGARVSFPQRTKSRDGPADDRGQRTEQLQNDADCGQLERGNI
jgi:hypothetical protein